MLTIVPRLLQYHTQSYADSAEASVTVAWEAWDAVSLSASPHTRHGSFSLSAARYFGWLQSEKRKYVY